MPALPPISIETKVCCARSWGLWVSIYGHWYWCRHVTSSLWRALQTASIHSVSPLRGLEQASVVLQRRPYGPAINVTILSVFLRPSVWRTPIRHFSLWHEGEQFGQASRLRLPPHPKHMVKDHKSPTEPCVTDSANVLHVASSFVYGYLVDKVGLLETEAN